MLRRKVSTAVLTAASVVFGCVIAATPAHAGVLDATCTGTETREYSPGLLLSAQDVDVDQDGVFLTCLSTDPGVTGGTYSANYTGSALSCLAVEGDAANLTRVFRWNDSSTSTMVANRVTQHLTLVTVSTYTGTITSGKFAGDSAVLVVTIVNPSVLNCLSSPGATSAGGSATLEITSL